MEGEQIQDSSGVSVDTTKDFHKDIQILEHISELRRQIRDRFETVFKDLPEFSNGTFKLNQYMKENPQSIIFVPEKDLNMFPVIIEEAKTFSKDFKARSSTEKGLNQIREHEFEHLQKAYELGADIKGMGFIIMKHKDKPIFGGFVMPQKNQEISLRDRLRIKLAPKTLAFRNTDDMLSSELLIAKSLVKAKSWEDFDQTMKDVFFVISERYLPEKVHNIFQKLNRGE